MATKWFLNENTFCYLLVCFFYIMLLLGTSGYFNSAADAHVILEQSKHLFYGIPGAMDWITRQFQQRQHRYRRELQKLRNETVLSEDKNSQYYWGNMPAR